MSNKWRIQDFAQVGAATPKIRIIFQTFVKNYMKMKKMGPPGAGHTSLVPPPWISQCKLFCFQGTKENSENREVL